MFYLDDINVKYTINHGNNGDKCTKFTQQSNFNANAYDQHQYDYESENNVYCLHSFGIRGSRLNLQSSIPITLGSNQ